MPRPQKGEKTPGSGRKPGTHNKRTMMIQEKADLLGIDPITVLLFFAGGKAQELGYPPGTIIEPQIRMKAASEVSQYLAPKLKAIEHSGPNGEPIAPSVSVSDEQLAKMAAEIARQGNNR